MMTVVAVFSLVALLAGCGDDDEESGSPDEATTETTEREAPELTGSVTIFVIAPMNDPKKLGGEYPEVAVGARAAAAEINADGGLNGKEIKIEVCDTNTDPNEAVNCAQRAADSGAVAVVGGQENAGNYAETLRNAGIPNVAPYASAPILRDPNTYPLFGGQLTYLVGGITAHVPLDAESVSIVYVDAGALGAQLQGLVGLLKPNLPPIDVKFVPVSPNQGDYSSIVTTAAESDGIFLATSSEVITKFIQTAQQLGIDNPISAPSATVQGGALEDLGDLAEGIYSNVSFTASAGLDDEATETFVESMSEIDPDAFIDDLAANAYLGVKVVAAALEDVPEETPQVLVEKLNAIEGLDLGLVPPIQFTKPLDLGPLNRIFNTKVINVQVEDGKLVARNEEFVDVLKGE